MILTKILTKKISTFHSFCLFQLCLLWQIQRTHQLIGTSSSSSSYRGDVSRSISRSRSLYAMNSNDESIWVCSSRDCHDFMKQLADELSYDIKFDSISTEGSTTSTSVGAPSVVCYDASSINDPVANDIKKLNSYYFLFAGEDLDSKAELTRQLCKHTIFVGQSDRPSSAQTETGSTSTTTCPAHLASAAKRFLALSERIKWGDKKNKYQVGEDKNKESLLTDAGMWSSFISLTSPQVEDTLPIIDQLRIGVDALELRVDLLADQSPASLHRQIALLREMCPLPIVFTVRTRGQIGRYPDGEFLQICQLLREGLRAGAEWIDVEANLPPDVITQLGEEARGRYKATSRLLGSYHVTVPQTEEQVEDMYRMCDLLGYADVLKVVTGAEGRADSELVHWVGGRQSKPYIGLCLGAAGSYSRVLNQRFTPVTHALLAAAAPGQLTTEELMRIRQQDGLCTSKKYFLFGTPIQQSLSPAMHNLAYQTLLIPSTYGLDEQTDVGEYQGVLSSEGFGGASVTIPHKESIMPLLDEVRGAAVDIGAVNTIVAEEEEEGAGGGGGGGRRLIGYNTDWIGMQRPILRLLLTHKPEAVTFSGSSASSSQSQGTGAPMVGLVIGAGGTARAACYAVRDLGLRLVVANRNLEKAQELARRFGGTAMSLKELNSYSSSSSSSSSDSSGSSGSSGRSGYNLDPSQVVVIISTLPHAAGLTVPPRLLGGRPVVLDVVYKPARTALIQQALDSGSPFVQGATMLLEQGVEQFELWNRRRAPFKEMESAIFNGVEKL